VTTLATQGYGVVPNGEHAVDQKKARAEPLFGQQCAVPLITCWMKNETLSDDDAALCRSLAEASAKVNEPWLSFCTSADMAEYLAEAGFASIELFGPDEASNRYLLGRRDGARLPGYFQMAKATATI